MAGLTSPSVAVVISPWVTRHLTLASLKTGQKKQKYIHNFLVNARKICKQKKLLLFLLISNKEHTQAATQVSLGKDILGENVGRRKKTITSTPAI